MYRLVTDTDSGRVAVCARGLPVDVRAEPQRPDHTRRDLSCLQAELILVHGTDNDVIPVGHSERLRDAVGDDRAHLFPAFGLHHVDVSPDLREGWQLWRPGSLVLRLADAPDGSTVSLQLGSIPPAEPGGAVPDHIHEITRLDSQSEREKVGRLQPPDCATEPLPGKAFNARKLEFPRPNRLSNVLRPRL